MLPPTLVEAQVEAQFHSVRGFGFALLVAVLCELCGKEELNREERQGFAKDAKQVRGLALRSWRQSGASFAVRRTLPRRTPRIRKGRKAMVRSFGFAFLATFFASFAVKKNLTANKPLIRKGRKATH